MHTKSIQKDGKTETLLCLNDDEEVPAQKFILEKKLSTIDLKKLFFHYS